MKKTGTYKEPKRSNSINKYNSTYVPPTNNNAISLTNNSTNYFCHYKNAMYMGCIKSFKKDGKGILLHDSGTSVLTNYLNDVMHGHNVFFAHHCLLSAEYTKGRITEAVYRTDGFLAHLFYNNDNQLQGKCKLLSYINKTITYALFKKGTIHQRHEQKDFTLLNKVFDIGDIQFLIGSAHAKVMKYDFQKANNIEGNKYGNKLVLGFEKGGFINGLAFTIIFRGSHGGYNPETHRNQDEFQLKITQRGYMYNSQLNGFGQKWFKNENYYIGEFKNGIFQGNGLLRNTAKKNWVSGYFEKGNLVDLLEYNNQGEDKKFDKVIEALHERKTNWINNEIVLISMDKFDNQIQKILNDIPNHLTKTLEQRKQEVLKRIQDNFLSQSSGNGTSFDTSKAEKWKKSGNANQESIKHFVHSFIPQMHSTNREVKFNQNGEEIEIKVQEQVGNYKLSSSRRQPNTLRKTKIFEKSLTPDRNLFTKDASSIKKYNSKTPQKKKIFELSSTSIKSKLKLTENKAKQPKGNPETISKVEKKKDSDNSMIQNSLQGSHLSNSSSQRYNNKGKGPLSTPKNAVSPLKANGKPSIFKKLKTRQEEISPKFIYTNIQNPKDPKLLDLDEPL